MRRLWRRLFGPRERILSPPTTLAADWCCVCLRDLRPGEVWEIRQHFARTGDEPGDGGSWVARTFCREHAPAHALPPLRSRR